MSSEKKKKLLFDDWLDDQQEVEEPSSKLKSSKKVKKDKSFKQSVFDSGKGKVLLELQKSYKGDSRFKLDKRFKNDVEVEKLPQNFKSIASDVIKESVLEDTTQHQKSQSIEQSKQGEVSNQLKLLSQILPQEKSFIEKTMKNKIINQDKNQDMANQNNNQQYLIARFNPLQQNVHSTKLVVKVEPVQKKKKEKQKKQVGIKSGIDKKMRDIKHADHLLSQNNANKIEQNKPIKVKKLIKKIDYQGWKEIIENREEDKQNTFSLFG